MKQQQYIQGIDGLRAISVIAVIAFHYFGGFENAGYLGVDVFFVISGFVITASLLNQPRAESLAEFTTGFYLRRFRRLLPALVVVVLFTTVLTLLITADGKESLRTGALSLIGGANIFLYIKEADYFALTSELNPFTHMWSLAVEDQFYLLFPFLLYAVLFFRPGREKAFGKLLVAISALAVFSLCLFAYFFVTDFSFTFYMMPTRFWQIGAGVITYLAIAKIGRSFFLDTVPVNLSILLILVVLLFGYMQPAIAHVAVVVFTCTALAGFWKNREKQFLISGRLPTYLGKLSYSLYLWHWPFLVFAKHTFGVRPSSLVVCLVLTLIFAMASYHWVEKPIRYGKKPQTAPERKRQFQQALTAIVVATLVLYIGVSRYSTKDRNLLAEAVNVGAVPSRPAHPCHGWARLEAVSNPLDECLGGERSQAKPNRVFILGDSHAHQFVNMISEVFERTRFSVHFMNAENDLHGLNGLTLNENFIPTDFQYVLDNSRKGDLLVLAFHRGRLNRKMDEHETLGEEILPNGKSANFTNNMSTILPLMKNAGIRVLLIRDTPLMATVTTARTCALQIRLGAESVCKIDKMQDLHTRKRQDMAFDILKAQNPEILFWDPLESIYSERRFHDVLDPEGRYLMYDWSHITDFAASQLKPDFEKLVLPIIEK